MPSTANDDFTHLTYAVTIDDTFGDGLIAIYASALGAGGATVTGVKLETFVVDTQAPILQRSSVEPQVARRNIPVTVRAEFDEAVGSGLWLGATPGGGQSELHVDPISNRSGQVTFTFNMPANVPDGTWQLALHAVTDLAGNPLADAALTPLRGWTQRHRRLVCSA